MIRRVWDWFWYGRVCTRCGAERTGEWDPALQEVLCTTCRTVEEINLRARAPWSG